MAAASRSRHSSAGRLSGFESAFSKGAFSTAVCLLLAASHLAISAPAYAKPTAAGEQIIYTATIAFSSGGIEQPQISTETSITVDRNIAFTVSDLDSAATIAAPGATSSVTAFKITNLSNAVIDLALAVGNQATGETVADGVKVDSFDADNLQMHLDSGENGKPDGKFDPASDPVIKYLDEMGIEQEAFIFVTANIPVGIKNQRVAGVRLVATAHEGEKADEMGAVITASKTADTKDVETVLSDLAGAGDQPSDGVFGALDTWSIFNANLTLIKRVAPVSSPLPIIGTIPLIPGSKVEICVIAANGEGNNPARDVVLSDPVPKQFKVDEEYGIFVNGTETDEVCHNDGQRDGKLVGSDVTGRIAEIGSGQSFTLRYRATVR